MKGQRPNASKIPNSVDGIQDNSDIAEHFMGKFDHLFNCVAYDKDEMYVLNNDINEAINSKLPPDNDSNMLLISPDAVRKGINNLKGGKKDGNLTLPKFFYIQPIYYMVTYHYYFFTAYIVAHLMVCY